jgi:hypothetical protein
MFKQSGVHVHREVCMQADSGYQGINKYHGNSSLPYKHTRNKALTKEQQQHNHTLSADRVPVEHTIRRLKVFRILSERYRNRRKRFALRVQLIAGICNYQLFSF